MGIVNVTPDSFSDGGRHQQAQQALAHALKLIDAGADIIDIGGESTRPGAAPVSVADELHRVLPLIEALMAERPWPISIDTSKPQVMRAAVDAGAVMINDVNALREADALDVAAELGVAVCLMHMRGEPRTMQHEPSYGDVVAEVGAFLAERSESCLSAGIAADRISIDPGFGFGKTLVHNLALLRAVEDFRALDYPVLVGLSRKSMLGVITGRPSADQRLAGSLAAALLAAQRGAAILRVHDVAETVDVLKVWRADRD